MFFSPIYTHNNLCHLAAAIMRRNNEIYAREVAPLRALARGDWWQP